MSVNLSNIYILNIKNADYRCIISKISNIEAIKLFQSMDLNKKVEHHKKQISRGILKLHIYFKF